MTIQPLDFCNLPHLDLPFQVTITSASAPNPKPFSISLGKAKSISASATITSTTTSSSSSRRLQPAALLAHHDSDSDGEEARPGLETVTQFGTNGATNGVRKEEKEQKLVIKSQGNQDWRRRGRNLLPPEVQARQQGQNGARPTGAEVETIEVAKEGGLRFAQRAGIGDEEDVEMPDKDNQANPDMNNLPSQAKTDDERALEALLSDGSRTNSSLIIPQATDDLSVFRSDVSTRPDAASLADYAAVPVEEFGAALLRGMGWKEGEEYSTKRKNRYASEASLNAERKVKKEVERRPALLGIGAKSEGPNGGVELGAWGKSDMRKAAYGKKDGKGAGEGLYNPVMLRDKRTGEMVSEEELRLRKLEALEGVKERPVRGGESDRERKRSRSGVREGRRRDGDGYRERSRDRDRRKENDRQRDRSRDRDYWAKNGRIRKEYDDDSNERSTRDKERDRRKRFVDNDGPDSSSPRRGHKDRERERDRNGDERRHRHRNDRDDLDRDRERNRRRKEEGR